MQLVDELSMIYTSCLMAFATFGYGKTQRFKWGLGIGLVSLALGVSGYYHYLQDPGFHQTVYAALTTVIVFRCVWVMEVTLRQGYWNPSGCKSSASEKKRDLEILRRMWVMFVIGLSTFLLGFYIWHLDNTYCSTIRSWRRQLGMPWGFILEGHAWWYVFHWSDRTGLRDTVD